MSDDGRAYVKEHSPYKHTTFWFHFVMGDIANAQHGYEIFVSDRRLAQEWPFTRGGATRARQELLKDGYLTVLDEAGGPGKPRTYRFEFKGAEHMRRIVENPRQNRAGSKSTRAITDKTRANSVLEPARNPVPGKHGTEFEPEETKDDDPHLHSVDNVAEVARLREVLNAPKSSSRAAS